MTDSRSTTEQASDTINERVLEPMKRAGEAMKASGEKAAERGSVLGMKVIDQAETNAREAFSAMRAASQAKDLSEVMRIQSEYLREQGSRNMAQAREIGEFIMEFGREASAPFRGENQ